MKRLRLSDVLKSRTFQKPFGKNAERNPFDDTSMDDFVRDRGSRQGLDKVSRSFRGPNNGVNGSRYDNIVRKDELNSDSIGNSNSRRGYDDYVPDYADDGDNLYLSTKKSPYKRNEFNEPEDIDDIDVEAGWAFMRSLSDMHDDMPDEDSEGGDDSEGGNFDGTRYDGVVRSIKGAYLVSKDKQPDATYKEVWVYNVGDQFNDESNIRSNILAGTDIDPTKNFSEDGSQESHISTVGNVQFLTITGLPD